MFTSLEVAILRTIIYFDLVEYPLTQFEIWKYLFSPNGGSVTLGDVVHALNEPSFLGEYIDRKDGYIFLKGRDVLLYDRLDRAIVADHKYRSIRFIIVLLAHIPFVRMICTCNTLALGAPKKESDIDLFIVARKGHLWFVRLLCVCVVMVFARRPSKGKEEDALCLSFYASDNALDLSLVGIADQQGIPDMYLLYWMCWCVPLYDDGAYEDFYRANAWIERYIPHRIRSLPIPMRRISPSMPGLIFKKLFELATSMGGDFFEWLSRLLQEKIVSKKLSDISKKDRSVIMNDYFLKLHTHDRRQELRTQFIAMCDRMGVGITL